MTQRYKATLEYDGSGFAGWQFQPDAVNLQAEVERALAVLNSGVALRVTGAGRTDAGVHALGQVISFDLCAELEPRRLLNGFNALVDRRIAMTAVELAPPDFDAQRCAKAKLYRYTILNRGPRSALLDGRCWHVRAPLDLAAMSAAAACLRGEHDFAAFCASDSTAQTTLRRLFEIELRREDDLLLIDAYGAGFLKHMVRNIVGTLVMVGAGKQPVDWVKQVLLGCDRTAAGRTAPAEGLCLIRVDY